MRITADVNSVIPNGINVKQSASVLSRNAKRRSQPAPASQNIQSSLVFRLQRERALGDALSIAQMSQSVIQKAMNVTSRLRSIASQAFSGGSVNSADLNQVVSQIDNIIGEYGESVSLPAVTGRQATGSGMAAVIENLKSIREAASEMNPGNSNNLVAINNQLERLSGLEKASAEETEVLRESMNRILAEYPAFNNFDIAAMSRRTAGVISGSPGSAVNSHNSLHAERVHINVFG